MKTIYVSVFASIISANSMAMKNKDTKLFLFKDLAGYQAVERVDLDNNILQLPNTSVLESFKIQVYKDGKRIPLKMTKIMKKSDENIFHINKGKKVKINNGATETLVSNGGDFVKTSPSPWGSNGFTKYTSKSKIESIEFEMDINVSNHIAQLVPFSPVANAEIQYSYALGDISWQAKYNLHLLPNNKAKFDYFIEIDNGTQQTFEDVSLRISTESIQRVFNDFDKGNKQFIFSHENTVINNPVTYSKQNFNESARVPMQSKMMMADTRYESSTQTQLVMGKESIVFNNPITIPSQTKVSLDYDIDNEFEYTKQNTFNLQYQNKTAKDSIIYNPSLKVTVKRDKAPDSMNTSAGVVSVYAGEYLSKAQLLKEQHIGKMDKDNDFKITLFDNNSIKIRSKAISEKNSSFYYKDYEYYGPQDRITGERERREVAYRTFLTLDTAELSILSHDVGGGETLKIVGAYFTFDEKIAHRVKNIMDSVYIRGSDNKSTNIDREENDNIINKINKIMRTNHTFEESELKSGISKKVYVIRSRSNRV